MKKFEINQTQVLFKKGDITEENCQAIVNAANSSLMGGGGVDGAIHSAGGPEILKECKEIREKQGKLPTGQAVITTGGELKAEFVIHTVGPVWHGGNSNEDRLLKDAYHNSLKIGEANSIKTICFPSISTGTYNFPIESASKIAVETIKNYLESSDNFKEVRLILFNDQDYNVYTMTAEQILS